MFDITTFTPSETTFLHLKSPKNEDPIFTGKGDTKKAVGITLHAPGSEGYEAANKKRTARVMARNKKKIELTPDLLIEDAVQWLADVTVSFDNLGYPPAGDAKGEDLFKALYADRKFAWVNDQVNTQLADWANFLPVAPKS